MEEECAICLQKYLYPVTLPCKHTFCFLCIKGIRSSSANKKCALCRVDFSLDVLEQQLAIAPPKIENESQLISTQCANLELQIQLVTEKGIAGLKLQDQNNTPDNGASVCDNLDSSNEEGPSVASNYSQSQSQNSSVDQSTEQLSSPGSDLDTS
ncbi:CLUMA_CG011460, isoform A, partial [Clunio marinus]